MTVQTHGFMAGSWELHPVFDVPDTFPPAVMFAIRDSDPRPQYEKRLQSLAEMQRHLKMEASASVAPEIMRQGMLHTAWDLGFRDVSGDQIGMLFRNAPTYTVVIKSNEPAGQKWLVTRAVVLEGKSDCWCLPIEVRPGERTEVALTQANMTTLKMA
jgi:hypothetical protein